MSKDPRISVVVPCFNERRETLEQSLGSVARQTFPNFECLVVDESTDPEAAASCRAICESDSRFQYLRPDGRLGLPGSLNLGISRAKGCYIARFDSDDVCASTRLEEQFAFLEGHPDVGVLGGALRIIDQAGRELATRRYPLEHDAIARGMQITTTVAHPAVMLRKALLDQHGVYDTAFRYAEDIDLWLRLLNAGVRFANLSSVLISYRTRPGDRPGAHWRYNLKARVRNLGRPYVGRRLFGIAAISAWAVVPSQMRTGLHGVVARWRGVAP
jgi:glycosyltransferase involved in cell wall biosynthesis